MSAISIRVLYFGIVRERLGLHDEQLQLAADSTVAELLAELSHKRGLNEAGVASLRVAVNREYVDNGHKLADGDEAAIIPPVSGGRGRKEPGHKEPGDRATG